MKYCAQRHRRNRVGIAERGGMPFATLQRTHYITSSSEAGSRQPEFGQPDHVLFCSVVYPTFT